MKTIKRLIIIIVLLLLANVVIGTTLGQYRDLEANGNYIILLIHGTGGTAKDMEKIYDFMTTPAPSGGLGLKKVYKYSFNDKFGSIRDWSNEIDQFMSQASSAVGGTQEANFIFVCHSAGGLAARYYVNNSGLYKGNVKKIVTINTPNLGSSVGSASVWVEKNRAERYLIPISLWALVL